MIVYSATRKEFSDDVLSNQIAEKIHQAFKGRLHYATSRNEVESWKNSMQYMNNVLLSAETPDDARVGIEYKVPLTSKRLDFILTGMDEKRQDVAVIVELKQWSSATATDKDAIVESFVGGARRELLHPSYQAWSYAALIRDFNETVQNESIALKPCAYLHNCEDGAGLADSRYKHYTDLAPLFLRDDVFKLRDFLKRYVKYGDQSNLLYRIDNGRLKPSRSLADHLSSLLSGNKDFKLIDEQKLVYERALALIGESRVGRKQVFIVEGGPGTGKSVVAVNLLVETTNRELLAHYVTRNAAPRDVYQSKLTGLFTKTHISNLFKGSGVYTDSAPNSMDVLIVDEAHRLNEKSGFYKNLGENQIREIIASSKCAVFFIDESQQVTLDDIGRISEIRQWANTLGAEVHEDRLASQFRCNGSDGYLSWVDNALQISETANETLADIDYDFQVFDSPNALFDEILEKNKLLNKARLVAGYCWDWKGKKDPRIKDVVIPEFNFAKRWNLGSDGNLWIIQPDSVHEVGCIHTCQGLELDYVGVIIGPDLIVRDGVVVTDAAKRSSQDRSIRGHKKLLRADRDATLARLDSIIKNTYRTLMTRGQKGCYVYSVDPETNEYFRRMMGDIEAVEAEGSPELAMVAEESGKYLDGKD